MLNVRISTPPSNQVIFCTKSPKCFINLFFPNIPIVCSQTLLEKDIPANSPTICVRGSRHSTVYGKYWSAIAAFVTIVRVLLLKYRWHGKLQAIKILSIFIAGTDTAYSNWKENPESSVRERFPSIHRSRVTLHLSSRPSRHFPTAPKNLRWCAKNESCQTS